MQLELFREEQQVRRSIVKWGKELYSCGMVRGSGGNISVKLNHNIIFTPSGYFLGHLSEDSLSKTDFDGNLIDGLPPTKEVPMHIAAYKSNNSIKAVVHTHSTYATALASILPAGTNMPIYLPSVGSKVGNVKIAAFKLPGSSNLADSVRDGLRNSPAVLLSNHGIISTGGSIQEAISIAYEIEENAQFHFVTQGICTPLSEETIKSITKRYF